MARASIRKDRRSAVALLFAILAIPITGLVGLAIDFGYWNQTYASLSLAASGAAMNAVKIAAAETLSKDPNAKADGVAAGKQWFVSQVGPAANYAHLIVTNGAVEVNIPPNNQPPPPASQITAQVVYTGTLGSVFGNLFSVFNYPLRVSATATQGLAPYLDVEILLDNSPSMEIGATPNDIAYMMALTTCQAPGAAVIPGPNGTTNLYNPSGQDYSYGYQYTNYTQEVPELSAPFGTVNGELLGIAPPLPTKGMLSSAPNQIAPYSCLPGQSVPPGSPIPQAATAGPPCAFACHFDKTNPPGKGQDFFAAARSTVLQNEQYCYQAALPQKCQISLRFDLVKSAVNQVITTMQGDDLPIQNLKVGIFSFANDVNQAYPANCEPAGSEACQAGDDWATAQQRVGAYPTQANQAEPGIQPQYTSPDGENDPGYTNFPNVMTSLYQQYLTTKSGDGTSAAAPTKVLFMVTDGVGDYSQGAGGRIYPAFDPALCDYYKNTLGYQVYVVYTPYYSLMNTFYLTNIMQIAEPLATSQVATNLQACTSNPSTNFVVADPNNPKSIADALQNFLQLAITSGARFTQ